MVKDLSLVLENLKRKIDKFYNGKKRENFNTKIELLIKEYQAIKIPKKHMVTYESLVSKGKALIKESNVKNEKKVSYYLRYCAAAEFDFKDNVKPLNFIMKSFLLTCTLFFVLAPQYFSFILPLIFVVPIFLGLRGMRKRVLNGLMMGISVVPMGILVAVVWLRNAYLTIGTFDVFVNNIAKQYHFSFELTKNLTIVCILLSTILLGSSITLFVSGIRYRKMFV
jgi:uncharacterized membrane protein (DUF485 family)